MEKRRIRQIFRKFYGSGAWASAVLNVPRPTISMWLRDKKTVSRLDREMPALAARIEETKGRCIGRNANGMSARAELNRLKRRRK